MPRKKLETESAPGTDIAPEKSHLKQSVVDESTYVSAAAGYVALSDFEQRYIVELLDAKGKITEEVHTLSARAGETVNLPDGWKRDTAFEQIVFMKQDRIGATFILPTGKRVSLPVKES